MKSSSCAGTAHKPICRSCVDKLLLVIVIAVVIVLVPVFSAGEVIVSLQIMRTDIERLGLWMAAEIEGNRCGARLTAEQECDGGSAWRVALQCFDDGASHSGNAVLLQQLHQLRRLSAGRFSMSEGLVEKLLALGHGLLQMAQRHEVDGLALELEHCFLMNRIEYKLVPVIGARMLGNLERAVENAHSGIGSHQSQLASNGFRRNGV